MLDKTYDFITAEADITQQWHTEKLFACQPQSKKPPFSIVIPPPNVTGNLHVGHALDNSIQDVLCRYKRMTGYDVLWQPGTDHAGIATQMVVERDLAKSGQTRHDLGREKFVEKIWEWKNQSGGQIVKQLQRIGASADWDRERFTLDDGLSRAVRRVFVQLYKEGLIYKDKRLANWDSKLQTAISDLEVVQKETTGTMWYIKYPVENSGEFITVATTRPETMFGDAAVAVSADDNRYNHLIGKNIILPLANRPIPIIADIHANPEKGTGAVKITPAHDFNDFEVGKRHNLPLINILNRDALLSDNVPASYIGLDCLTAREKVVAELQSLDLLVKQVPNEMTIPHGDRSNVVIEPLLTDQWFVNAKELAVDAMQVVKDKQVEFIPANWENTYFEWMNNIQPWCISRQLWWGHQVPVWYGPDNTVFCEETEIEAQKAADLHYGTRVSITRDSDVLDTWFSSALWAFSTFGWPDETDELKKYYPTSVLVSGFDIIFFWIARMLMTSMHFMKEIPFHKVYLHGLVRDEKGQKMSKSKGNGIDPLHMCDKYGADALRFALLVQAGHGRDVLMSDERVAGYRNFITKIWNAARFCEMNGAQFGNDVIDTPKLPVNQWILSKLSDIADKIGADIEGFAFNDGSKSAYHFIWDDFCALYLEGIKPIFNSDNTEMIDETQKVCGFVLENMLKIAHPFIPFITEEIYRKTAPRDTMIMATNWPIFPQFKNDKVAQGIDKMFALISSLRALKAESNIPAGKKISIEIADITPDFKNVLDENKAIFTSLARIEHMEYTDIKSANAISKVVDNATYSILLDGLVDTAQEIARLTKEIENLSAFVARTTAQLANEAFTSKAPAKVIDGKKATLAEAQESLEKCTQLLHNLQG